MHRLVGLLSITKSYIIFFVSLINVTITVMEMNNNTTTYFLYTIYPIIMSIMILFLFVDQWMGLKQDNTDISMQNVTLQLSFDCVILCW